MFDSDFITFAVIGASLSVSLIHIGHWLLHANPRAVLNAGKWSIVGLISLMPSLLLWLVMTGRSTLALTLTASVMPALIWSAPRWRALFAALISPSGPLPRSDSDYSPPSASLRPEQLDPDLVRRSVIVLSSYLDLAAGQGGSMSTRMHTANRLLNGPSGGGRQGVSIEEALDILGLEATAGPSQISEAHRRLQHKLKPELGDTHYLIAKIDEAMEVLLMRERNRERKAEVYDGGI
jgi:hypothetical protein